MKKTVAWLCILTLSLTSKSVRADPVSIAAGYTGIYTSVTSTYVASGVLTTAGIVFLVLLVVDSTITRPRTKPRNNAPSDRHSVERESQREAAKQLAVYFLREQSINLASALATGDGPVLHLIADSLSMPHEHRARFGRLLQAHHAELLDLANLEQLTPDRAGQFVERMVEIATADEALAEDFQRFAQAQTGRQ